MLWLRRWEFCRKRHCRDRDSVSSLRDRYCARQWLQQFGTDVHKMLAMRTLLQQEGVAWQPSAMSDEEVIDHTAELLISGRLHVHALRAPAVSVYGFASSEPPKSVPFPLSDRRPRPQAGASNAPASDPPTFPPDIDGAAQANALAAAAAGGQPFCPE